MSSLRRRIEARLPSAAVNTVKSLVGYRPFYRQSFVLRSGVRINVRSHPDWIVFNEIFVNGDYDRAIADALGPEPARATRPFVALDLGANSGFFTLRLFDLLRRAAPERPARVIAVEGAQSTYDLMVRRVVRDNGLGGEVTALRGLVGARTGQAAFSEYPSTTTNNIFDRNLAARQVPYVDLEVHLSPAAEVDLLKCDIEGAEELFLNSYPDLLRRTRVAAVELHARFVDVEACRRSLREAGLTHRHSDGVDSDFVVDLWVRDPPMPA